MNCYEYPITLKHTLFSLRKFSLRKYVRVGRSWLVHNKEFTAKFTFGSGAGAGGKTLAAKCSQALGPPIFIHNVERSFKSDCGLSARGKGSQSPGLRKGPSPAVPVTPACSQTAAPSLACVPVPGRTRHSQIPYPNTLQPYSCKFNTFGEWIEKGKGIDAWYLYLMNARGWWRTSPPPCFVWFGTTKVRLCWSRTHCRRFP